MPGKKPQIAINKTAYNQLSDRKYEFQRQLRRDVSYAEVIDDLLEIKKIQTQV